ncbi:2EXR domain-containing protein [Aspergillus clavatus NRRL 1]|uniref:2EXR domain-containing protein n=1 Tax=Aspergillus clavatus (strain ATCC 1007 / CBS 513.65 / DSM 816 / NCTC 3887 / NRRL 1 / QM 1276 / 107) TaxID=344612 RepID=A1CGY2_ASPCL|nr:uncharacterized protein ACLA_046020 [Aspergillus clavatus NRRL 1]EAW10137.1 conserved hypothetical protein [Aspergillus clavatus NRRL 1]
MPNDPTTTTTTTFHLFPLLPPELRLRIWSLLLSTPRNIPIACQRGIHPNSRRFARFFTTPTLPPPLLHVNHESRTEALRIYTAQFQTAYSPRSIYIAFDRDVLQLPEDVLAYLGADELDRVQALTIEVSDASYFGHFYLDVVRRMRRLRRLELVLKETRVHWRVPWDEENDTGVGRLKEELQEAMTGEESRWECPCAAVRIVAASTGVELGVVEALPSPPLSLSPSLSGERLAGGDHGSAE